MDADLHAGAAALAELNTGELLVLADATNNLPQLAPGLLVWRATRIISSALYPLLMQRAWMTLPTLAVTSD